MQILVTGANGQLGREMQRSAACSSDTYIFTDVDELDITDASMVSEFISSQKIDVVVNCAAYTNVDKAEDDFETANLINNIAVKNLATACAERDAVLIHISTDYVFLGDKNTPCMESELTNPIGAYGRTKLSGEESIVSTGCRFLIFRTAWLYSAYGNNFVKTMRKLTAERESLSVVFDQVGTPTYAADLAELICGIIERRDIAGREGVYHYSNEGVCSWYDFAQQIARLSGNNGCRIEPCYSSQFPSKVKRPHFSVLDKSRVKEKFGVSVPYWLDSLERCIIELKES